MREQDTEGYIRASGGKSNRLLEKSAWVTSWYLLATTFYLGNQIKQDEMSRHVARMVDVIYIQVPGGNNLKERNHLEDHA
jgi:hypothetical protein